MKYFRYSALSSTSVATLQTTWKAKVIFNCLNFYILSDNLNADLLIDILYRQPNKRREQDDPDNNQLLTIFNMWKR